MGRSKKLTDKPLTISAESFKNTGAYFELKQKYPESYIIGIENDQIKMNFFYDCLLPSLAVQVPIPGEGLMNKFICFFPTCFSEMKSFVNKQIFSRHLYEQHSHQIPGKGEFLGIKFQGYQCEICDKHFSRKDYYNKHLFTMAHINKSNLIIKSQLLHRPRAILWHQEWHNGVVSLKWHQEWHDDQKASNHDSSFNQDKEVISEKKLVKSLSNLSVEGTSSRYAFKRDLSNFSINNDSKRFKASESEDSDLDYIKEIDY